MFALRLVLESPISTLVDTHYNMLLLYHHY